MPSGLASQQQRKERNVDRLLADVAGQSEQFLSLPDVISFHTSEFCNLRCVMCARSVVPARLKLAREALSRVCESLFPTARIAALMGGLGEPLLGDADVIIEAARRHGVGVDLVTNGLLLTPEFYARERDAFFRINVSVDSHVPEIYESIRRGGCFATLKRNLEGIRDLRLAEPDDVYLSMSAVVMRSNIDGFPEFVRFAGEMGADVVSFQPLRSFGPKLAVESPFGDEHGRRDATGSRTPVGVGHTPETRRLLEQLKVAAHEARVDVHFGDFGEPPIITRDARPRLASRVGTSLCTELFTNYAIMPNGDVFPCCHPTRHRLGNVLSEDPRAIWNGTEIRAMRRSHFKRRGSAFCRSCLMAPYLTSSSPSMDRARRRLALVWSRLDDALGHLRRAPVPTRPGAFEDQR